MPPRSEEEKLRRRLLHQQKQEARRLKKQKEEAEKKKEEDEEEKARIAAAAAAASSEGGTSKLIGCPFSTIPEEAVWHILCYLEGRELGSLNIAWRTVNYGMEKGRVVHFMSRVRRRKKLSGRGGDVGDVVMDVEMCEDENEARSIIQHSLQGSNGDNRHGATGRCITKKSQKGSLRNAGDADEYVAYAKFLEEALGGYALQKQPSPEPPIALPPYTNGRFASLSPEHTLLRVNSSTSNTNANSTASITPISGVASYGVGRRGQLGHATRLDKPSPTILRSLGIRTRIIQVSAGGGLVRVAHSLLLTEEGRVLSFGSGAYGQLGHGYAPGRQLPDVLTPRYITSGAFADDPDLRIVCVAAGEIHSAAVSTDGDVYTWGDGFCGQLGGGDKRPRVEPQPVVTEDMEEKKDDDGLGDEVVVGVSCGARHTLCWTELEENGNGGGEVWSWGLGFYGVLGRGFTPFVYHSQNPDGDDGEEQQRAIDDVQMENLTDDMRDNLDRLATLTLDDPSDQCLPRKVDAFVDWDVRVVGASAGHRHSIFLDSNGSLYTCGVGSGGALGHGNENLSKQEYPMKVMAFEDRSIKIISLSAGVDISMAVSSTGTVYSWGKTTSGRIGLPSIPLKAEETDIPSPLSAPNNRTSFTATPTPVQIHTSEGEPTPVRAVDVECGYVHSLILGIGGEIYECGGVGVDGREDGVVTGSQRGEDSVGVGMEGKDGQPVRTRGFNVWHRLPEVKPEEKKKEEVKKWKKYGKYELKGRRSMMSEKEKWGA